MADAPRKPAGDELDALASKVELLVFDVDGVLTDGGLYYGPGGEAQKRFDVRDGHGIVMARLTGLKSAVLTARTSEIVEVRGRELGLVAISQGRKDKRQGLLDLLASLGIAASACAYMGDDLNDLGPMEEVALPACPSNAAREVRQRALFISHAPGGAGAARELTDLVMKATGRWERAVELMRSGTISKS